LDPFIIRLTSITDDDLAGRAHIEDHLQDFIDFVGDAPIVGQNVQFDIGFLNGELNRIPSLARPKWKETIVHDTMVLSRIFFPFMTSHSLSSLTRQLKVKLTNAHRAVNDASATAEVFLEILKRARRSTYGELNEMSRQLGSSSYSLGALIDGLIEIGPGDAGVDKPIPLRDNRIGDFKSNGDPQNGPLEIDDNWFDKFFSKDSELAKSVKDYQTRDGQVEMAKDVYRVLDQGGKLIAEAETGTGKSIAYLLPSIIHAAKNNEKIIVSTNTKHLQNQLFDKDLPALSEALGVNFKAVLLKGRGNYMCNNRYEKLVADPEIMTAAERIAILPLVKWLTRSQTGDIEEIPGFRRGLVSGLWSKISADSGFCNSRNCRDSNKCFLYRIRMSALKANIVLINHALLFSDLANDGGVLGEYSRLIVDEAHHLEKTAANYLGISYSTGDLKTTLNQLYDSKNDRGVLSNLKAYEPLLLSPLEMGDATKLNQIEQARESVAKAFRSGNLFGTEMENLLKSQESARSNSYSSKKRYLSGIVQFDSIVKNIQNNDKSLGNLLKDLDKMLKAIDDLDDLPPQCEDLHNECKRLRNDVESLTVNFRKLTGKPVDNIVTWYEIPGNNNRRQSIRLYGAPLDVGTVLTEKLYPKLQSLVLTSATLAVNKNFKYISGRLGIDEFITGFYSSPFQMEKQLHIAVVNFAGHPKGDQREFSKGLAQLIQRLPLELDAGTLALFTSQVLLSEVYDQSSSYLERSGWMTLAQRFSGGQSELLQRFRDNRKSVLFGVDSFWEGIDVPGESLELAIIAKLPFDVPTEPLIEARSEKLAQAGKNPFMHYTLPESALKLRQGIGRLIRTTKDVGAAVICDPRLIESRWGKVLANSLPVQPVFYTTHDELVHNLEKFLREN
jgi:ATP-dependent DNA helicase DinG